MRLRVVSWNVAARRACVAQSDLIAGLAPDVVVLQELTRASWPILEARLSASGLAYSAATVPAGSARLRFVGVASRYPVHGGTGLPADVLPSIVSLQVAIPALDLGLLGVHIPTVGHGFERKLACQKALLAAIAAAGSGPLIVAGDFNSPQAELPDGTVVPFHRVRQVAARELELALLGCGPAAHLLRDAFRALNGFDAGDLSWYWKNRGRTGGYRLDHIFAAVALRPLACWYEHGARERGLSDHAPIVADFEL